MPCGAVQGFSEFENLRNEMQHMLDDTGEFANMERYIIHPTKSGVLTYSNGKKI